jgi:hypothetical protein
MSSGDGDAAGAPAESSDDTAREETMRQQEHEELTATDWIEHCAVALRGLAPGLDHIGADEYARLLRGAWPDLRPEDAAKCFLCPETERLNSPVTLP